MIDLQEKNYFVLIPKLHSIPLNYIGKKFTYEEEWQKININELLLIYIPANNDLLKNIPF